MQISTIMTMLMVDAQIATVISKNKKGKNESQKRGWENDWDQFLTAS
jgi:hypothetical protein